MKLDLFLFIFALALAFISGNITYSIKSESTADFKDLNNIKDLHIELQEEQKPLIRLDLNIDYPTKEQIKLLTAQVDLNTNQNTFIDSTECLYSNIDKRSSSFINKNSLWMAYYCNQIGSLPNNFFQTPPYVSPSGHSYAFLNLKLIRAKKDQLVWINSHAKLMTIKELRKINWSSNKTQLFLINQPQHIIQSIVRGDNIFLSDQFYFIKTGNLKYFILNIDKAHRFFKRTPYTFSNSSKSCLFKIGNICWNKNKPTIHNFLSQSIILLFIGTIIILFLTANSLFERLKKKKQEEERKKHALRVLTHELRTPIASLLLHSHQIQKYMDELPAEVQDELIKIEGQIYRLKHLAQKSQGYLQTDSSSLIHLNVQEIDDVEAFFKDITSEYQSINIELNVPKNLSISTDPYWLKMCITNLIENALKYGTPPFKINITEQPGDIKISVIDDGKIAIRNIKELLKTKHQSKKGLGLGLIIINKTIREMGGEFTLKSSPTEFIIKLPKKKVNNE